ncbi:MAG TPA: LPS assembly lipoprotein LptE [Stellaceae bacterium]|nr:LPS assembly lipoprotein LptE [Stellaceae bacterium]
MSWSRRSLLASAALLTLGGCGWRPLYAPRDRRDIAVDLAAIKVNTIPNRLGQLMTISLRDGLNPTNARVPQRYLLTVQLAESRVDVGYRSDGTTSRSQITMTASFSLHVIGAEKKEALLSGSTRAVAAFDVQTDDYATVVAQQSAEQRSLNELSDDIQTRLAIYIKDHKNMTAAL